MIRILHVIPSLGRGGAERQLVDVVSNSDASAFEHVVCHLQQPADFRAELERKGKRVIGLELQGKRPWGKAMRALAPVLREVRPHVVHEWLLDASVSSRVAQLVAGRVPHVVSLQSPDYDAETVRVAGLSPPKIALLRAIDVASARLVNLTYVPCSRYIEEYAVRLLGARPAQMRMIYNSVDTLTLAADGDARSRLRRELGIRDNALVFVTVGRLDPPKGHRFLIDAFSAVRHHDAHLVIVGDGPSRGALESQAAPLSARVHFLGRRGDVGACLEAGDVFVFATLFEGFGIAVIEGLAKGLPCVSTNVGPLPEMVKDGETGFLVPPASAAALAVAMQRLADDGALRSRLGENALRDVARFSSHALIPQWEALYRELAGVH